MATPNEQTAIKVALIGMASAIIVALIANADKFRAPSAPPPPVARDTLPANVAAASDSATGTAAEAQGSGAKAAAGRDPDVAARREPAPVTIRVETPRADPPPASTPASPALAPGDMRAIPAWGVSKDGIERRFTISNRTSQPMVRLFVAASEPPDDANGITVSVAPIRRGGFGPDRLGGIAVPPGATIAIDADDGDKHCEYDMKAVFADGRALAQNSFNVCAGANFFWTFGSGG